MLIISRIICAEIITMMKNMMMIIIGTGGY